MDKFFKTSPMYILIFMIMIFVFFNVNINNKDKIKVLNEKITNQEKTIKSQFDNIISLQSEVNDYISKNKELSATIKLYETSNVKSYQIDNDIGFKAYMSYKAVTDTSSEQYALLNSEYASTDKTNGLRIRKVAV